MTVATATLLTCSSVPVLNRVLTFREHSQDLLCSLNHGLNHALLDMRSGSRVSTPTAEHTFKHVDLGWAACVSECCYLKSATE